MIEERIYSKYDLHHGICESCGDESDEITDDGRCVDCVELEHFIEMSYKLNKKQKRFFY